MPQMSPLMWLVLFFIFIFIFLIFNILNYFNFSIPYSLKNENMQTETQNNCSSLTNCLSWKW